MNIVSTMKAYQTIVLGSLVLAVAGCNDFFSNESPTALGTEQVFSDVTLTEQAMGGVYQAFAMDRGYPNRLACGFVGLNTDIEWSTWSTGTDDKSGLIKYDPSNSPSDLVNVKGDIWVFLSTAIERSNNIIEGIQQYGDLNNSAFRYYLGEAYFLRSFAYLEMIKYWGDVPARFVSLTKDPNGVNARKTDHNVIYDQLRIDLKKAADLMPWSTDAEMPFPAKNNVGRPSKAAALALLARADMMYAGKALRPTTLTDPAGCDIAPNFTDDALRKEIYEEVMRACGEIITKEGYKLASDSFALPFHQLCEDVTDYSKMEHIWVIPYANASCGQVLSYNAPKLGSSEVTSLAGLLPGIGVGAKSNGHACVSPYLVYQYEAGDKRRDVTFVPGQWGYAAAGVVNKKNWRGGFDLQDGDSLKMIVYQKTAGANNFYLGKYRYEWMQRECIGNDGIDFPVIRYADVLLMFAEASIGSNMGVSPANPTTLDPLAQFNKIRTRAGVATAASLDIATIQTERAKEFCGEYIRKWDLMRWGILKEEVEKAETFIRTYLAPNQTSVTATLNGKTVTIYNKYRYKYSYHVYTQDSKLRGAWEVDSIVGLAPDEDPGSLTKAMQQRGWLEKKDLFGKNGELTAAKYPIYNEAEKLKTRQYWPIFMHHITASNGNLWNNYGY